MMRMECFFLNATFQKIAKNPLLGQKNYFLGLGKQPKTNRVKLNYIKKLLGCLQTILYQVSLFEKQKVTKKS